MTTISFVVVDLTPKHILELNVIFFFLNLAFASCRVHGTTRASQGRCSGITEPVM